MSIKCSVCLELITENCEVKSTPCGHLFHANCLEKSIKAKNNCPKCRKSCTGSTKLYIDFDESFSESENKYLKLLQNATKEGNLTKYQMKLR